MYLVRKGEMQFYVNAEKEATRYAENGYEVFQYNPLILNENGELEKVQSEWTVSASGSTESAEWSNETAPCIAGGENE